MAPNSAEVPENKGDDRSGVFLNKAKSVIDWGEAEVVHHEPRSGPFEGSLHGSAQRGEASGQMVVPQRQHNVSQG